MKKAQANAVVIVCIALILFLIGAMLAIIIYNPNWISPQQKPAQKYTPPLYQYSPPPLICNAPYMQVGSSCCLDANFNRVCDSDEQPVIPIYPIYDYNNYDDDFCSYPFTRIGSSCCIDDNNNNICDYQDDDYDESAHLNSPFSLYDYDIANDEIELTIRNRGSQTVTITHIEIDDCDDNTRDATLERNERERFTFDCDSDNRFDRDIRIEYSFQDEDPQATHVARGNIQRD